MANVDSIGAVFSAELLRLFRQMNVWPQLVRDYSAEVSQFGDSVKIPEEAAVDFTPATITKTEAQSETLANHAWGDPNVVSSNTGTLTIDEYRRINELVPGVAIDQLRFDLVANASLRAATTWAETYNDTIRAKVEAALGSSRQVGNIAVSASNFASPNNAFNNALKAALRSAALRADYEHWPMEGRYAVLSARVYTYLEDILLDDKNFLVTGINDNMLANNVLGTYRGWMLIKDASAGDGVTAADDAKHSIFYGVRGYGISAAQQTRSIRAFNSEVHDGVVLQGRMQFGVTVNQPSKVLKTLMQIN